MQLRDSVLGRWYFAVLRRTVLKWLGSRLSPDQMTLFGVLLAALVPLGFAAAPLAGFLLMGLSALADSLDGQLAKLQGGGGPFGAFLDSTSDRVSDGFYLAGFWVAVSDAAECPIAESLAVFAALVSTGLISYSKARIEGLGGSCATGLMDRAVRTIFLLLWALALVILPARTLMVFWIGLGAYLLLVAFTVGQRIRLAHQILAK